MPTAINPKTGEILTLGDDGQWAPAQRAQNPQTGEQIFLDGAEWKPVPYRARMPEKFRGRADVYGGFGESIGQGATFGFGDEIKAVVNTGLDAVTNIAQGKSPDLSKNYDENLEFQREMAKEYRKQHPVASMAGELVGGFALAPVIGAGSAVPTTLKETMKQGAKIGGTVGAITGFGTGEGGLENRATSAAVTGGLAALLGGATPAVIEGGRAAFTAVKNFFGQGDQAARAERLVARAIQQDKMTPQEIAARVSDMESRGITPMVTDVGGENVQRLARAAATVPGEGTKTIQKIVDARNLAQAQGILGDVKTYLSPVDDFVGLMDGVGKAQARAAAPLYDDAYNVHKFVWNDRIQQFLDEPLVQKGIREGIQIQRLEALAEGKKLVPQDFGVVDFNAAGENIIGGKPNLRLLDAAKRGLDEMINATRSPVTGKPVFDQKTRAIEMVRKSLVDEIDRTTAAQNAGRSLYKEARQAWAGPAAAKDALAFGRRDALQLDPEEVAKRIASMSESEREFAKAGVARAISDIVNGKADDLDVTKGLLRNPTVRARMKAVFGDDPSLNTFIRNIETRREMAKTDAFISPRTGSQSTMRATDVASLLQDPGIITPEIASQALTGNLVGAAMSAGRGQIPRLTQGITSRTGSALADLLTRQGTSGAQALQQRLQQRLVKDALDRGRFSRSIAGLLAPEEGAAIGLLSN